MYNPDTQSYEEKQYQDYDYDSLSRLSSLTYKSSQSEAASATVNYTYNNNSQLAEKIISQNGNSIKTNYTYNNAGLIKTIQQQTISDSGTSADIWNESYSYRLDGNLYKKVDSANQTTEYGYDAIGRLTSEFYSEGDTAVWSASYSFDDFDNRTKKVYNDLASSEQITTLYTYDLANKLTGETVSGADEYAYIYNYDNNGNLLSKVKEQNDTQTVEVQNTYDEFNRVAQTITPTANVTYRYDSAGHRISKASNGIVTNHFWDGDNIISDLASDGQIQNYIYGASGIEALAPDGTDEQHNISAYLKNMHGDVVSTHSLGNTSASDSEYKYDSYGNELLDTSGTENPFRYSGQYFDEETGYYYLRARYYDPQSGRFTQEDSYHGDPSDPATLNLYGYCAANPVRYQDPSGHWFETIMDVGSLIFSIYDMCKDPSWTNFGFLLWDAVSLLPYVPGSYVGKVVKAVDKVDTIVDTYKTVKRTSDVIDTAVDTGKAIKKSASVADKVSDIAKTTKKTIQSALETSKKKIAAEAAAMKQKLVSRTQETVSQLKSRASQALKKADVNVGGFDCLKSAETAGKRVDFYVTPQGDAIPGTRAGLERNLSMMQKSTFGANIKYTGTNSFGVPMRVRPEGIHPTTDVAAHLKNPYHEVPHIHFEYRSKITTGGWGDGFKNNHILPQSWFN